MRITLGPAFKLRVAITKKPGYFVKGQNKWKLGAGVAKSTTLTRKRRNWGPTLVNLLKIGGRRGGLSTPYYYVRLSYGYFHDNFGRKDEFYNDGTYTNAADAKEAILLFLEEARRYEHREN